MPVNQKSPATARAGKIAPPGSRFTSSGAKNGIRGLKRAEAGKIIKKSRAYRMKKVIFIFTLNKPFLFAVESILPFDLPVCPLNSVAHLAKLYNRECTCRGPQKILIVR
jgi:hypothetical protein